MFCSQHSVTLLVFVPPVGVGSALGGLGNSGLPDPFISPPPRKEGAAPTPVKASSSQHLDYFSLFKSDGEGEEEGEEGGTKQSPPVHTQAPSGGEVQDAESGLLGSSPAKPSKVRQIFSEITGSPTPTAPQPAATEEEDKWDSSEGEEEEEGEEKGEEEKAGQDTKAVVEVQQEITDEEEEESEWEIERRASRQSLSPSRAKSPLPDLPSVSRHSPLPPLQLRSTSPPGAKGPGRQSVNFPQTAEKQVSFSMGAGGESGPEVVGGAPSYSEASPNTEKQKMDDEASERLHRRDSELQRVLQQRRKHVDAAHSSPDTRKPVVEEADKPIPRSASVPVSQMKSVWEGQGSTRHSHPLLPATESNDPPVQPPPLSAPEGKGQRKEDQPTRHASKMADSREDAPPNVPSTDAPQLGLLAQSHSHPTPPQGTAPHANDTHAASQWPSSDQGASDGEPVSLLEENHEDGGGGGAPLGEEEDDLCAVSQSKADRGPPLSLKDLQAEDPPPQEEPSRPPVSPAHSAVRYTLDTDTQDLSLDTTTTDNFSASDKVCVGRGAECSALKGMAGHVHVSIFCSHTKRAAAGVGKCV